MGVLLGVGTAICGGTAIVATAPVIEAEEKDVVFSVATVTLLGLIAMFTLLVIGAFVGFEVISRVPNTLHTPLMSATNAIHGIVVLGGILLIGEVHGTVDKLLCVIAIAFGTINVVGGFLVTDRMLEMFRARPKPAAKPEDGDGA